MTERPDPWQRALAACERAKCRVVPLDPVAGAGGVRAAVGEEPPAPVAAFVRAWLPARNIWQALVASAGAGRVGGASGASGLSGDTSGDTVARLLRPVLDRAGRAAVVVEQSPALADGGAWGYLVEHLGREGVAPAFLRLHLPATPAGIAAAEDRLAMRMPPVYAALLRLTNGLGLDEREGSVIVGAGPSRASWPVVTGDDWLACQPYHEITASWRVFQGVYAQERADGPPETWYGDLARAVDLVPVLLTRGGDAWCLDRARQAADGDCPVVFWDHELRETGEQSPGFAAWLRDIVVGQQFDW